MAAYAGADALTAELQQRISLFRAGDEQVSGKWLVSFQNAEGAWQLCAEALRTGPRRGCSQEFLDTFCAQTLAMVSRALTSRVPAAAQGTFRGAVEALLALHLPPQGQGAVWRQLALALTCTDLWLGKWSPSAALEARTPALRLELLTLPTELLFCDRALPLSDVQLWRQAAAGLLEACGPVFAHLVSLPPEAPEGGATDDVGPRLQAVAAWLRAARLSFEWLPGFDGGAFAEPCGVWPEVACTGLSSAH